MRRAAMKRHNRIVLPEAETVQIAKSCETSSSLVFTFDYYLYHTLRPLSFPLPSNVLVRRLVSQLTL
jgi:hypothetical protein